MNYNNRHDNDSTTIMRIVCAVAFVTFSFSFLYLRQSDVLSVAQHVLSGGQTTYSPTWGAVIITLTLMLLHRGVNTYFPINRRFHWLTYFPSFLLLTIVTDISPDIDINFSMGAWLWLLPLLLVAWFFITLGLRNVIDYEADINSRGLFSRLVWINLFALCTMSLCTGLISGGDDLFHHKAKMETLLVDRDFAKAAIVGEKTLDGDPTMTMLRSYALSREGRMADEMFRYAVNGTSETLLPTGKNIRLMLYPTDSIYRYLGARPLPDMTTRQYLSSLLASGYKTKAISDYILCGKLVDRDLDGFARELPLHYNINDSLPQHYREALVLYTHRRANPLVVYKNQVMDTDFDDFQKLEDSISESSARRLALFEQYFGTYWYYYEYDK